MGTLNLSKILVVDLEGTCWDNISRQEQWEKTQIIEFGITEIDLIKKEIVKTKSYLVNPYEPISQYCTELTTITQSMLDLAQPLAKVSKQIRQDFNPTNVAWGAWGKDNELIIRECIKKNAVNPFGTTYYDFQELYSMMKGVPKTIKMTTVLEELQLSMDGTLHRADSDSLNTAKIVLKMFQL